MKTRWQLLRDAVFVLASDAAGQLDHLRELGLPEGIDELALEYDDIAGAAENMLECGELDKSQYEAVRKLDTLLSQMSGKANATLWTTAALAAAPEWNEVRHHAKGCLRLLERNPHG
jgi:hypothetical protein